MLVLVTLVVAARFWIRFKLVKGGLGVDDWCILVAWILAVAYDLDPINREYFDVHVLEDPVETISFLISLSTISISHFQSFLDTVTNCR